MICLQTGSGLLNRDVAVANQQITGIFHPVGCNFDRVFIRYRTFRQRLSLSMCNTAGRNTARNSAAIDGFARRAVHWKNRGFRSVGQHDVAIREKNVQTRRRFCGVLSVAELGDYFSIIDRGRLVLRRTRHAFVKAADFVVVLSGQITQLGGKGLCFGDVLRVGIKLREQSGRKLRLFANVHAVRRGLDHRFVTANFRHGGLFGKRAVRIAILDGRIGNHSQFLIVVLLISLTDHVLHFRCALPLRRILNNGFKERHGALRRTVAAEEPAHPLALHLLGRKFVLTIKNGVIIFDAGVVLLNQFFVGGKRFFVFALLKINLRRRLLGDSRFCTIRPALHEDFKLLPRTAEMPLFFQRLSVTQVFLHRCRFVGERVEIKIISCAGFFIRHGGRTTGCGKQHKDGQKARDRSAVLF